MDHEGFGRNILGKLWHISNTNEEKAINVSCAMEIAHHELWSEEAQAPGAADAAGALLTALVMVPSISLGFSVLGGDEEECALTELESSELGRAEKLYGHTGLLVVGRDPERK